MERTGAPLPTAGSGVPGVTYKFDKPNDVFGMSSQRWRLAQQQQPITEHVYYTAWPVTPNLCNWPITDGLSSQVWKWLPCPCGTDCLKVPSGALGSAAWAARRSHGWNSLWTGVYDVQKVWTIANILWPGIKFMNFSRILSKLIKFLDFTRAREARFCISSPFPKIPDRWEPCLYNNLLQGTMYHYHPTKFQGDSWNS